MKFLILIASVIVITNAIPPEVIEAIKERIKILGGECQDELGATEEDLAPMKALQLPTTHTGKCFINCMEKKLGFQDQTGRIDKQLTYSMLKKLKMIDVDLYRKMKQVTDICLSEVMDMPDPCETSYNMMVCAQRESKRVGIDPMAF